MNKIKGLFWTAFTGTVFFLIILLIILIPTTKSNSSISTLPIFYEIDKENSLLFIFDEQGNKIQEIPYNNEGPLSGKIERLALFSTTYFPMVEALDCIDRVYAIDSARYCNNQAILEGVSAGRIKEVGELPNPNFEWFLAQKIDALIAPPFSLTPTLEERFQQAGIRLFYFQEWLEQAPLARASWLQVMGILLGQSDKANQVFNEISQRYQKLLATIQSESSAKETLTPLSVLVGTPWSGTWYLPGGGSYMAQLISDAGGQVIGPKNSQVGSLPFAPEKVIAMGAEAPIWLVNALPSTTKSSLLEKNPLYAEILAVQNGRLFNNTKVINAFGGNDFYESAILKPDWLLSDLYHLFKATREEKECNENELHYFVSIP